MELTLEQRGPVDVLAVDGAIHAEDNAVFEEVFVDLSARERFRAVVDARRIEYMNSRAVGTLVAFAREARTHGGGLALVKPTPMVTKLLATVGLLPLVPVFETIDEAVGSQRQPPDADSRE